MAWFHHDVRFDHGAAREAAHALRIAAGDLERLGDEVAVIGDALTGSWWGANADAGLHRGRRVAATASGAGQGLRRLAVAVEAAAAEARAEQRRRERLRAEERRRLQLA